MKTRRPEWTPYGHEAHRQKRIWRRRIVALALGAILAGGLILVMGSLFTTQTTISTDGGGSTVSIDRPEEKERTPDATLTLTPGELTVAPSALQAAERTSPTPQFGRDAPPAQPIPINLLLLKYGPAAAVVLLAIAFLRRSPASQEEVNYGVYKGALPLENISARYAHLVKTSRATYENPFGKSRRDYLPPRLRSNRPPRSDR